LAWFENQPCQHRLAFSGSSRELVERPTLEQALIVFGVGNLG